MEKLTPYKQDQNPQADRLVHIHPEKFAFGPSMEFAQFYAIQAGTWLPRRRCLSGSQPDGRVGV